jgi:hypothetical protein
MPNVTLNLTKWYHYLFAIVPVISLLGSVWYALDTRHISTTEYSKFTTILDQRYVDLQIRLIKGQIRDYNRIIDSGETPSAQDTTDHDLDKDQLKNLTTQRNEMLGLGGLPE